jgi:hypothetical protein
MNINNGEARLVLLCPAWKKWGTVKTVKPGTFQAERSSVGAGQEQRTKE